MEIRYCKYCHCELLQVADDEYWCVSEGCRENVFQEKLKPKPKVIIIDNNPLSIASYMEEHPDVLD